MMLVVRISESDIKKLEEIKARKGFRDRSKAVRFCIEFTEINTRGG